MHVFGTSGAICKATKRDHSLLLLRKATVGGTADRKVPALQPGKSQGDYYRQQDPTEVPPSQDPGIDDSTKPVNNDSCADDPMSRHLRAHPWRSDQQDGDTGLRHRAAVPHTPDQQSQSLRLDPSARKHARLAEQPMNKGRR